MGRSAPVRPPGLQSLIIGAEICAIAEALNFAARFGMNANISPMP